MKNNKCITKKILESVAEIAAKEYYGDNIYENQGEETLEVAEETLDWVWLLYARDYIEDCTFEYNDLTKKNKKYLIKSLLEKYHDKCIEKIEKELNSL